jgi:hypothetical protein
VVIGETKMLAGEIAEKNSRASADVFLKFRKFHVQLERLPKAFTRFLLIFRANQEIQ